MSDTTTIDRLEEELQTAIREVLDRHPMFKRMRKQTRDNMVRGGAWGAIRVLTPEDFGQ